MSETSGAGVSWSRERRALLERWAVGTRPTTARDDGLHIPPLGHSGPAPLSFAQERLWFLEQLHPGQSIYVIPVVLRLRVEVSPTALEAALGEIVRRHAVLRSAVVTVNGVPHQEADPVATCPLRIVDLRHLAPDERFAAAREHLHREQATPFDLAGSRRLRATLITLDAADHVFVATFHHIAFDGWSTTPFLHELTTLYGACVRHESCHLPELAIQYRDYAAWQREWLSAEDVRRPLLDYWRQTLAGVRTAAIPADRPRPPRPSYRAGRHLVTLPAGLMAGLRLLAQREGVTPFMVLLAAVNVLVQRYSVCDDVCVGTSVAGRSHAELEPLIGCCLNTLVLRTDMSGDPHVSTLLGRTRESALGAFAHQALPFELLLQHLQPTRDLSRTPYFQVYVNYLNVGETDPMGPAAHARDDVAGCPDASEPERAEDTHAPFELSLYAQPVHDALVLTLVHAHDLFEAATARRLLADLRALLAQMIEQPEARVSTLALSERAPDIDRPSPRRVPVPLDREPWPDEASSASIGERFRAVARTHAARVAVCGTGGALTYETLATRSLQVARALEPCVALGDRVGLLVGHDVSMPVALLGTLQSGAAYVPLDPSHPLDRLAAVATAARLTALLVDPAHATRAGCLQQHLPHVHVVPLDVHGSQDETAVALPPDVPPDSLAYVLFTSGTTGRPKGVMQSHRHVLRHVGTYVDSIGLCAADTVSLLATYGFDAAVMDIFGALLTGATLQLISLRSDDDRTTAEALSRVTVLHATPTVFRLLMASPLVAASARHARVVVLGGEPALSTDVGLFRRVSQPGAVLVNGLGPSESTLALQHVVFHDSVVEEGVVPVGHPVATTAIRLVNVDRQEVAQRAVGEIAITSDRLALGYWDDDALTARMFVADAVNPVRRTYFSGDLAWRDDDGCLHFVGRRDAALKVHGIRLEPEEVECRLLECNGVVAAAVSLTGPAADVLTAHVVWQHETLPDAAALRAHLLRHLPEALVPTLFVRVERLPRTPSGKIDRRALPPPASSTRLPLAADTTREAPQTPTERHLAAIWNEVLGLAEVGRLDNFFELGGHSLLATQVVSRLRATLGRAVPLRACFEAATLAALAEVVDRAPLEEVTAPAPTDSQAVSAARQRYKVRLS